MTKKVYIMSLGKSKIDFNIEFFIPSGIKHMFYEGEYEVMELYDGIPLPVSANIEDENCQPIGSIRGYFLKNVATKSLKIM